MRIVNFQLDSIDPIFIYSHLEQLPFLRSKIAAGTSGVLRTYGCSPMSWTSFWTGQPPPVHGINKFWKMNRRFARARRLLNGLIDEPERILAPSGSILKDTVKNGLQTFRRPLLPLARTALRLLTAGQGKERRPFNRHDVRWVTGYQVMEKAGLRVGLVNSLFTYPAWSINGYVVSDWTMPLTAADYYYPPQLQAYLQEIGYKETLDRLKEVWGWLEGNIGPDPDVIYERSLEEFQCTKRATLHLMRNYEWDFHATMFRLLDTAHHLFTDNEVRLLQAYQVIDCAMADLADQAALDETQTCWLINSDHGAYLQWPDQVIRGGHDRSGFYCFTCPGVFRAHATRTLRVEDLMPILLHLSGIDPFAEMKGQLVADIFLPKAEGDFEDMSVTSRLRALGYL